MVKSRFGQTLAARGAIIFAMCFASTEFSFVVGFLDNKEVLLGFYGPETFTGPLAVFLGWYIGVALSSIFCKGASAKMQLYEESMKSFPR